MKGKFREGALGAILDEYEKAVEEFKLTISDVSKEDFVKIADAETKDPECVSIQTVTDHTINAGYGYVYHIKKNLEDPAAVKEEAPLLMTPHEACNALDAMMKYTADQLSKNYSRDYEEVFGREFKVPWGQTYDFEQILEHAIVHVLRHRRQIEKFKSAIA